MTKYPMFLEQQAFDILKEFSFPRLGGTDKEKAAAAIIRRYLASAGLKSVEETFTVQTYQEMTALVEVLSPYRKKYQVAVTGNTGSTPDKGTKGELVHLTAFDTDSLDSVKGKIVITYCALTKVIYQKLLQKNIKALIRVTEPVAALRHLKQNDLFSKAFGKINSVMIGYEDALEMIHQNAQTVNVISRQKEFKAQSRNIIATVKGTELPNERIIICGHYDSVNKTAGCLDNAAGSATIADFARYFAANPPKRTITFIWFGSEELGLKGSWAYTERHKKELMPPKPPILLNTPVTKLVINVDVAGTIFGNNGAVICGSETMANFIDSFAKEKGLQLSTHHSAYSSDNIPFNEKGIPSIAFNRSSSNYGHTPMDNIKLISPEGLKVMGQFGLELVNRIVNSVDIPFELSIPEPDKKSAHEYVERANPFYRHLSQEDLLRESQRGKRP